MTLGVQKGKWRALVCTKGLLMEAVGLSRAKGKSAIITETPSPTLASKGPTPCHQTCQEYLWMLTANPGAASGPHAALRNPGCLQDECKAFLKLNVDGTVRKVPCSPMNSTGAVLEG